MFREFSFLSFNSIRAKFLAFVVPLVLLSTLAVFGLFEFDARRDANLKLQDKLDKLVAIQSAVVAESLWNVADEQITLILAALAIDPDVESAVVYDERDQLVGFTGLADGIMTRPFVATKKIVYVYDEKPEVIGRLAISLTDARLQTAAHERMFLAGVLAAILIVAVVFSALLGNRRTIGIPLERLLASINRSREGGERQAVEWRSNDEIGAVVLAFNELQERQKAYERELEEARDTLERRVEERTRDLTKALASLVQSEKLAFLGQLVASVAHEIRNPLNFVNSFAELSVRRLADLEKNLESSREANQSGESDQVAEIIELLDDNLTRIKEHGGRADGIIKTMLAHSRDSGDIETVDCNALADEATNLAYHGDRAQNPEVTIDMQRDFADDAGSAVLNRQEISRVLINLLSNSFHATRQRALAEPRDAAYQPVVRLSTRDRGESIEYSVWDNGTGMNEDTLREIFTPFFTTKSGTEGTGLGLSLSYDIVVRNHEGFIEADSRLGHHTEMVVRIPKDPAKNLKQK